MAGAGKPKRERATDGAWANNRDLHIFLDTSTAHMVSRSPRFALATAARW
ncbi:MAG: hypothetical protein JOZ49_22290 [Mycolicibacterium sp.]|nr:hypothetical protein [Mycolicibacterium sp.]